MLPFCTQKASFFVRACLGVCCFLGNGCFRKEAEPMRKRNCKKAAAALMAAALSTALLAGCGSTAPVDSTPESVAVSEAAPAQSTEEGDADEMAAQNCADLIDAIYVQTRTEDTDAQCEAAKAAWDALTDTQKEMVEGENADPDYFGRDTGDAALDDPRNADDIGENELLVVSFGTSFNGSRAADIKGIEDALQAAYPEWSVRRAFTAQIIINHVQARDGEYIDNMDQALERAVAKLDQKRATSAMEEKQILDKLWDNYELSRTAAEALRQPIENMTKANRQIAELRRNIGALGTPNLGAIDEFTRVNTRYTFLTGQRDDILKAKRELTGIIADVTGEMEGIFTTQFQAIDQAFRQTFLELFGGGKARLELEDENDILNCGIEIKVQPPGKQLKTITLLSGGEKAFVAIALYFAILKVHPTPFCVMDEIEAALDEANVVRYARYMRRIAGDRKSVV